MPGYTDSMAMTEGSGYWRLDGGSEPNTTQSTTPCRNVWPH